MDKKDYDVVEEAQQVVENKLARFHTNFVGEEKTQKIAPGYLLKSGPVEIRRYEGYGFRDESVCPDKSCKYYKYAGRGMESVCTHPNVRNAVEIGGVFVCCSPMRIFAQDVRRILRWLRKRLKFLK